MQTLTMQHQPWAVSSWLSWWQWLLISLNVMDQNVMDLTALRSCLSSSRNPTTSLNMLSTRLVLSWTWWLWRVGCRRLASQILLVCSTKKCWPFWKVKLPYCMDALLYQGCPNLTRAVCLGLRQRTVLVCCCSLLQLWRPDIFTNPRVTASDQSRFLSLLSLMQCVCTTLGPASPACPT